MVYSRVEGIEMAAWSPGTPEEVKRFTQTIQAHCITKNKKPPYGWLQIRRLKYLITCATQGACGIRGGQMISKRGSPVDSDENYPKS